jgi:hypothetical protein
MPTIIRRGIAAIFLALAACQGPIGRSVGPDTPSIGDLAAVTHETRLTLSGTKSAPSSIFIDGEEVVARDALTTWAAVVVLSLEGTNTFEIKALDDRGQISQPLLVPIVRDTFPPAAPTVTVTLPTTTNPVELTGTKEVGSLVRLDGRVIVPKSDATAWTYQATVAGTNPKTLTFTAVDAAGNESAATPVSVTLTTRAPRPGRCFRSTAGRSSGAPHLMHLSGCVVPRTLGDTDFNSRPRQRSIPWSSMRRLSPERATRLRPPPPRGVCTSGASGPRRAAGAFPTA